MRKNEIMYEAVKEALKTSSQGIDYMTLEEFAESKIKTFGKGRVIVKDDKIICVSSNSVLKDHDPTAHAEVNAIRLASKILNTHDLSGCILYASSEPCPMCLSALYWAGVSRIYYGNTQEDAASINFSDKFIYSEIDKPQKELIKGASGACVRTLLNYILEQ